MGNVGRLPREVLAPGHRGCVVGRAPGVSPAVRSATWTRTGVVMAVVVAPVVVIGGGVLIGRLAGWSWASAIFLGVVAYALTIQAAWVITGAFAVRRELQMWRGTYDWEQEDPIP
jgi:hypothetical protein